MPISPKNSEGVWCYSVSEAARILDVSVATLRRLIKSGRIGATRIGGQDRITHAQLERALRLEKR